MQNQWEAQKALEKQQKDSEEYLSVVRKVNMPKQCTVETYDDLIEYVTELYMNGMILGDEFVMKPGEDQRGKLIDSTFHTLYGRTKIGEPIGFFEHFEGEVFTIITSFGVKIIIK
jgi:hypothetical protein